LLNFDCFNLTEKWLNEGKRKLVINLIINFFKFPALSASPELQNDNRILPVACKVHGIMLNCEKIEQHCKIWTHKFAQKPDFFLPDFACFFISWVISYIDRHFGTMNVCGKLRQFLILSVKTT
jgi:hypothetical protein